VSTTSRSVTKRKLFTIKTVAFLSAIGVFLSIFIPSYFGWSLTAIISYRVEDGWCVAKNAGIGAHCFGDFFAPMRAAALLDPWEEGVNPNPPYVMLIFAAFAKLAQFTSERFALIVWIVSMISALALPVIHSWATSKKAQMEKLFYTLIYVTSLPIIAVIDRGNIIFVTVPLIYFTFVYISSKRFLPLALIIIAVLIKPQLVIFAFLFLALGKMKAFLMVTLFPIVATLFGFIFFTYPGTSLSNWLAALISYPDYASEGKIYPVNLSLKSTMSLVDKALETDLPIHLIETASLALVAMFFVSILINLKKLSLENLFYQLIVLMILSIGTSFLYYAAFLSVFFLLMLFHDFGNSIFEKSFPSLCTSSLFILIIPISPLSWKLFPFLNEFGQATVTITWTLAQCVLVLVMVTYCAGNLRDAYPGVKSIKPRL
jgi:hypothetical protein